VYVIGQHHQEKMVKPLAHEKFSLSFSFVIERIYIKIERN